MSERRNHVHPVECPKCHGVGGGVTRDGIEVDCSKCDGNGYVKHPLSIGSLSDESEGR